MMFAALALLAGAPSATAEAPTAQSKPITVIGQKDKKICRSEVSTGSVIPKLICMTAEEREALAERSLIYKDNEVRTEDMQQHVQIHR